MPLFHFNSRTGDKLLPDIEGEYLPDREAARSVAMSSAREALIEAEEQQRIGNPGSSQLAVVRSGGNCG